MRDKFINTTELLLLKAKLNTKIVIKETDNLGTTYGTAKDAIKGDDMFVQAIRFDTETMTCEDVTEECAAAWLDGWEGTPEDDVPYFVYGSEAYEKWCEEYRKENGFNPRRHYGTYSALHGSVA